MYYNYYQNTELEYDECTSKGICTVNPALTALHEVVLIYLKELAYYFLKLHEMGANNAKIENDIAFALSSITCNIDYSQEEFQYIMSNLYDDIVQCKNVYIELSERNNLDYELLKTYFKHSRTFNLTDAIKKGEKYILKRSSIITGQKKHLFDIMLFIIKSLCIKYGELKNLGEENPEACGAGLSMLSLMNFPNTPTETLREEIKKFIEIYYELVKQVYYAQVKLYGKPRLTEVGFSTRPGKAILVAGSDLKELELILKTTEKRGIDVYTHGLELLIAHTFPKFKSYRHLIGHYGTGTENCLLDFATFPGAILMTKNSLQKVDYLYRGRLFTTDLLTSKGVIKIKNHDFEPLIKSALEAKGFNKGQTRSPLKVGIDEELILEKVDDVIKRMESGEIKHLYIVGAQNYMPENKHYFEKFFNLMPEDSFAISLAYPKNADNIFHQDSFFDYALIFKILRFMQERKPLKHYDATLFITKCDKHTLANIIFFTELGIKNIYMCKCPPTLINPALVEELKIMYGIRDFSTPEEDIKQTLTTN